MLTQPDAHRASRCRAGITLASSSRVPAHPQQHCSVLSGAPSSVPRLGMRSSRRGAGRVRVRLGIGNLKPRSSARGRRNITLPRLPPPPCAAQQKPSRKSRNGYRSGLALTAHGRAAHSTRRVSSPSSCSGITPHHGLMLPATNEALTFCARIADCRAVPNARSAPPASMVPPLLSHCISGSATDDKCVAAAGPIVGTFGLGYRPNTIPVLRTRANDTTVGPALHITSASSCRVRESSSEAKLVHGRSRARARLPRSGCTNRYESLYAVHGVWYGGGRFASQCLRCRMVSDVTISSPSFCSANACSATAFSRMARGCCERLKSSTGAVRMEPSSLQLPPRALRASSSKPSRSDSFIWRDVRWMILSAKRLKRARDSL
eukprot:1251107-Prymnesium_polylepis.1